MTTGEIRRRIDDALDAIPMLSADELPGADGRRVRMALMLAGSYLVEARGWLAAVEREGEP